MILKLLLCFVLVSVVASGQVQVSNMPPSSLLGNADPLRNGPGQGIAIGSGLSISGGVLTCTTCTQPSGGSVIGSSNLIHANVATCVSSPGVLGECPIISGLAKFTLGVPSLAAASDVIALWSGTCNSASVLVADGTCQTINSSFSVVTAGTNTAALIVGSGGSLTFSGTGNLQTSEVLVSALGVCLAGSRKAVSDSNAASFTAGIGAIVAGNGSTHVPVYCDGVNWRIG
jgi:hypothetical protein